MTPELYERICQMFVVACDLERHAQSRYLQQECGGDEELRKELESLLAEDSQPSYSEDALRDAYLRLKLSGRADGLDEGCG
jgi:hypothetical protein